MPNQTNQPSVYLFPTHDAPRLLQKMMGGNGKKPIFPQKAPHPSLKKSSATSFTNYNVYLDGPKLGIEFFPFYRISIFDIFYCSFIFSFVPKKAFFPFLIFSSLSQIERFDFGNPSTREKKETPHQINVEWFYPHFYPDFRCMAKNMLFLLLIFNSGLKMKKLSPIFNEWLKIKTVHGGH